MSCFLFLSFCTTAHISELCTPNLAPPYTLLETRERKQAFFLHKYIGPGAAILTHAERFLLTCAAPVKSLLLGKAQLRALQTDSETPVHAE